MGYSKWLEVDPTSGSGNASVSVGAYSENTGRDSRSTTMTFKAANCKDVEVKVNQPGTTEFVKFDATTYAVDKEGGKTTITGVSNSKLLKFEFGTNEIKLTLPDTYIANSVDTTNGEEIKDDPGADAEYPFSITFDVAANEETSAKSTQLKVTDNAGNSAMTTIEQTAGDPKLEVEETEVNLDVKGTAVTVQVKSNTSWTVE